jgi:hypothetical protein
MPSFTDAATTTPTTGGTTATYTDHPDFPTVADGDNATLRAVTRDSDRVLFVARTTAVDAASE